MAQSLNSNVSYFLLLRKYRKIATYDGRVFHYIKYAQGSIFFVYQIKKYIWGSKAQTRALSAFARECTIFVMTMMKGNELELEGNG